MEYRQAHSETRSIKYHWLLPDEENGKGCPDQQPLPCPTQSTQHELAESVVRTDDVLLWVGEDLARDSQPMTTHI